MPSIDGISSLRALQFFKNSGKESKAKTSAIIGGPLSYLVWGSVSILLALAVRREGRWWDCPDLHRNSPQKTVHHCKKVLPSSVWSFLAIAFWTLPLWESWSHHGLWQITCLAQMVHFGLRRMYTHWTSFLKTSLDLSSLPYLASTRSLGNSDVLMQSWPQL